MNRFLILFFSTLLIILLGLLQALSFQSGKTTNIAQEEYPINEISTQTNNQTILSSPTKTLDIYEIKKFVGVSDAMEIKVNNVKSQTEPDNTEMEDAYEFYPKLQLIPKVCPICDGIVQHLIVMSGYSISEDKLIDKIHNGVQFPFRLALISMNSYTNKTLEYYEKNIKGSLVLIDDIPSLVKSYEFNELRNYLIEEDKNRNIPF